LRWRRQYARYRGKGLCCNFCGASYELFVPEYPAADIAPVLIAGEVIAGYGENVFCPRCGSKNRERLVKAVLEERLEIGGKKILHFSPEKQLFRWLAVNARVWTVDVEPGFYRRIDRAVRYADATMLPFDTGSFDLVIANHILEHIPDDAAAMKEMLRVLAPGGAAVLQVPFSLTLPTTLEDPSVTDPRERASRFGQLDHVRIYTLHDYISRLEGAGFAVRLLGPGELAPFRGYAIQEKEVVILGYRR
jgi:SAM-dependent methyltransferase